MLPQSSGAMAATGASGAEQAGWRSELGARWAEGRRGAGTRHSLSGSGALDSSRSQPGGAAVLESAPPLPFIAFLMSLGRGGPGGPARWPMAALSQRPSGAGRGAPDSSPAPCVS